MFSYNHVQLIGNITKDFEVKILQNGSAVCTVNLATGTRPYKDRQDQWQDPASYHQIEFFGRKAEQLGNLGLGKGSKLMVVGYLKSGSYEKNGSTIYTYKVRGEDFMVIPREDKQPKTTSTRASQPAPAEPDDQFARDVEDSLGGGAGMLSSEETQSIVDDINF